MKRQLRFQVPKDRAGIGLVEFLAQRFAYHTRDEWQERIAAGRVHLNGEPAPPGHVLAYRDRIESLADDVAEPPVAFAVEVAFSDADLLVLNKPPNLPCHPGGRYFAHTLWAWVRREAGLDDPTFVNRIDRETSGLVVVARHAQAARRCRAEFASHRAEKQYLALVEGTFPDALTAQGWLTHAGGSPVRKRRLFVPAEPGSPPPAPGAQWAVTHLRRVGVHGPISSVSVMLETGRLHQIRATLLTLGHPLVGDKVYGPDPAIFLRFCTDAMTDDDRRRLRLPRQALHAERLRFRHPTTRQPLEVHAPVPEDMKELSKTLEASGSGVLG